MSTDTPAQENAMTEIALALAMGFFSLMVLTLISMGAGEKPTGAPQILALAPTEATTDRPAAAEAASAAKDLILIFDGTRFLDAQLNPVNPETAIAKMAGPARRVVLALDPSIPLKEAMAARARVKSPKLVVSTLDDRWLTALKNRRNGK